MAPAGWVVLVPPHGDPAAHASTAARCNPGKKLTGICHDPAEALRLLVEGQVVGVVLSAGWWQLSGLVELDEPEPRAGQRRPQRLRPEIRAPDEWLGPEAPPEVPDVPPGQRRPRRTDRPRWLGPQEGA